jgi:hypothetical protein
LTSHLTPNIQLLGEAGRMSNILPSPIDTLLGFSPVGFGVSAWYAEGGVRLTSRSPGVRPYAETSFGFARLRTDVGSFGDSRVDALTGVALRFLDRTDPMATAGAGVTLERGPLVADVGYRYRRIFSSDWVNALALGGTLHTNEVRLGVGVRF